jgi:toxin ParE1/3/4
MSTLRLTPAARNDLSEIWDWTARRWDDAQANIYVGELHAGMLRIAEDPRRGRDRTEMAEGYRSYAVGKHVLWFTVPSAETVDVIRVLHQRMDPSRNL